MPRFLAGSDPPKSNGEGCVHFCLIYAKQPPYDIRKGWSIILASEMQVMGPQLDLTGVLLIEGKALERKKGDPYQESSPSLRKLGSCDL